MTSEHMTPEQMIYEHLIYDKTGARVTITLNRPEKKNAMSPDLHYEMDDALGRLETDPDAKVIVIMGAGGNFSAGQDLKKFFRVKNGFF